MTEFAEFWRALYPHAEPTGWLMRAAGVRHWVRFHSLPKSKRYAETEDEFSILLDRQNALASAALGENHTCWMAQASWVMPGGSIEITDESEMFREIGEFGLKYAFSFQDDEEQDGDSAVVWKVMAASVQWTRGGFDEVLLRIANDQAAPTLWVSAESGAVYAPYDGGVDLFLPSEALVNDLRSKHADWLSSCPGGL